ncbi:MAG: hypothetical protein BRD23_01040 [Halobacteriales archaeon SW_9_67_25]|nr:MAG: hypothetical protein BRD23_01040 [Halobacteriales archaeon SW_9_67_25]
MAGGRALRGLEHDPVGVVGTEPLVGDHRAGQRVEPVARQFARDGLARGLSSQPTPGEFLFPRFVGLPADF